MKIETIVKKCGGKGGFIRWIFYNVNFMVPQELTIANTIKWLKETRANSTESYADMALRLWREQSPEWNRKTSGVNNVN